MAKAEHSSDSSVDAQSNGTVLPSPIVLEASGPATKIRETSHGETTVEVRELVATSVEIEFSTVEDVLESFFTNGLKQMKVDQAMTHAPRSELKDHIDEALRSMGCTVDLDEYDEQWDVCLDGDAQSWLQVVDEGDIGTDSFRSLTNADCIGDGVQLAYGELQRRDGESIFDGNDE